MAAAAGTLPSFRPQCRRHGDRTAASLFPVVPQLCRACACPRLTFVPRGEAEQLHRTSTAPWGTRRSPASFPTPQSCWVCVLGAEPPLAGIPLRGSATSEPSSLGAGQVRCRARFAGKWGFPAPARKGAMQAAASAALLSICLAPEMHPLGFPGADISKKAFQEGWSSQPHPSCPVSHRARAEDIFIIFFFSHVLSTFLLFFPYQISSHRSEERLPAKLNSFLMHFCWREAS